MTPSQTDVKVGTTEAITAVEISAKFTLRCKARGRIVAIISSIALLFWVLKRHFATGFVLFASDKVNLL
jgi:hypothetical protein